MPRVTSVDFQQTVDHYSDVAMSEPVIITSHNRDRLVLLSIREYERLKELESTINEEKIKKAIDTHRETLNKLSLR